MKTLTALLMLISLNTFAIITKNCPSELEVTLGDFNQAVEVPNFTYMENPGNAKASFNFMKYMDDFTVVLTLKNTDYSKCRYTGDDNVFALISGSTKSGAKNPAKLTVFWSVTLNGGVIADYEAYIPLTDVQRNEMTMKFPGGYANVKHAASYCNWGECGPGWIDLGKANIATVTVN